MATAGTNGLATYSGPPLLRYDAGRRALDITRTIDGLLSLRSTFDQLRAAAHVAKDRHAEIDHIELRWRAERAIGELIDKQRSGVGLAKGTAGLGRPAKGGVAHTPPNSLPSLAEVGIDKNLAKSARRMWSLGDAFEVKLEAWREAVLADDAPVGLDIINPPKPRGTQGTGENEWYTPPEFLERARSVLGTIDLDPASSALAQRRVKAAEYFTLDDDGLSREWRGRVWMNPPYAQPAIGHFAEKLASSVEAGRVTAAVALTHNYTDTRWFHRLSHAASAICFPEGRIRFISQDGALASPTQGQAFFYFGKRHALFTATFGDVGLVLRP
jgi:phage N-6-adenine-methyltransferase